MSNNESKNNNFDIIVVGSGLGGLSTAGLLSKINKKKVLVLEKHYEIGGLTHEFKRGPYSWDVGLHYIGDLHKRSFDRVGLKLFSFLTEDKLKWNRMPEIFEKLLFPGIKIEVEEYLDGYKKAILKEFPNEKKDLNRYIKDVHKIRLWSLFYFFSRFLPSPFRQITNFFSLFNRKKALMTTAEYLKKNIKNEKLRAVLATRWGNYGVPVTDSAFAVHALIENHYYNGANFPDGGSERIASLIENTIEKYNGMILTSHEVTKILINNNKVYGVKVRNNSSATKEEREFYAPIVISDTGAISTYLKLLPSELNLDIQNQLRNYKRSYSGLDLYLGLKDSPEKLGIKGENYWISDSFELDIFDKNHLELLNGNACYCFLSFPSMKCGKKGVGHTADIVTIFPYNVFEKWNSEYWKERENEYYNIKEKIIESLLNLIEKNIPGFKELVVYKELATPLTFEHFTGCKEGGFYGLPATPERYMIKDLRVKTPIKGLYLTGTDILSNGIIPALFSGMGTVSYLNGPFGIIKVMSKVFSYNPKKMKKIKIKSKKNKKFKFINLVPIKSDKKFATLISRNDVSPNLIEITYKFDEDINFIPGQHIKINVGFAEWRAYSVAKVENREITLIVDTRPAGHGVKYLTTKRIGEKSLFRLPITDLIYHETERDICFIATGTGFIPFLHIMDELKKNNKKNKIVVIFGCLYQSDNFIDKYLTQYKDYFDINCSICVENPEPNSDNIFTGRVTDYIKKNITDKKRYEFYICGHRHMTDATVKLLRSNGADRVFY